MIKIYICSIFILSIICAGCTTNSKVIQQSQLDGFKKEISTVESVIAVLGKPDKTASTPDGVKIITYYSVQYKLKGTNNKFLAMIADDPDMTVSATVFKFDKYGKMISYESSSSTRPGDGFSSSKCPKMPTLAEDMKCKGL